MLTHGGIARPENLANFGGGWHAHLEVLIARVRGDRIPDFWALHAASEAAVTEGLGA